MVSRTGYNPSTIPYGFCLLHGLGNRPVSRYQPVHGFRGKLGFWREGMVPCFEMLMILQSRAFQNHVQNKTLDPDKISKGLLIMNVILLVCSDSRIILLQDEPVRKGARNQESLTFLTNVVPFLRLSPRLLHHNSRNNPRH